MADDDPVIRKLNERLVIAQRRFARYQQNRQGVDADDMDAAEDAVKLIELEIEWARKDQPL